MALNISGYDSEGTVYTDVEPIYILWDSECVSHVIMDGIEIWPGVPSYYEDKLQFDLLCTAGNDIRDYCETEVWMLDRYREPIVRYDDYGREWYEKISSAHPNVPNTSIEYEGSRTTEEMEEVKYLRIFSTCKQETSNTDIDFEYEIQYCKVTLDSEGNIPEGTELKFKTAVTDSTAIPIHKKRSRYYDYEILDIDKLIKVYTYQSDFSNGVPKKIITRILLLRTEEE